MNVPVIAIDARLIGTQATGDATYWRGLLHGFSQLQPNGVFLLFSNAERPPFVPETPSMRWVRVPSRSDRWWSLVRFPLAARRMGAATIHTQYNLSPLAGRIGVTTVHDVSFRIEPSWFRAKDRALLSRFVGGSIRRSKSVITVSETSAADIRKYYPSADGKLHVTLLAAGLGLSPIEDSEAETIVRDDLRIREPYLLTVGTRWPRKNMGLALDAIELLPEDSPLRLVVSGKPGWGETGAGKRSIATGYVDDRALSALYKCANLYLAPSRYEGFGLTILEAFSMGCPVLCSTGGAQPEVAGNAAEIIDSWQPADWMNAIQNLLGNSSKLAEMKQRGLARAAEFSWIETARRTWQVYCGGTR